MRNSEFLPNNDIKPLSYFAKLTAYTVPILMIVASIFAFEKTSDPHIIHGFILKEKHSFPSMNMVVYLYEHIRYKCPFLYISTDDTHNFFTITFKTVASDNSGALHVLQHIITHGSEHYPVRHLFQELKKRSFATLLSSFTSNEWISFPFSTTNINDFHNILDVYLDAIFHPLINNETFFSECHRLEFENPFDHKTPLHHDGTVYNEVHDEYLNSNSRFVSKLQENLYPDSLLKNRISGTPEEISKLTVKSLKQAHFRYFHPSNALLFHYGSFPVELLLSHVSEAIDNILVSSASSIDRLYNQAKWSEAHNAVIDGQLDENSQSERRIRTAVSWLCGDLRNVSDIVDLEFLSILLTHSTVSPLYRGLLKTEFGTRFLETGFHPVLRTPYFSIGLEGFNPTFMSFNQTVLALLGQIYKKGFEASRVKSLLNRHEMRQKSIAPSQGLKIWKSIIGSWIHGVSPIDLLDPSWEIERLKRLLSVQPHYFEMIMKQKLIDNSHRLDLSMNGLPDFNDELIQQEKVILRKMKNNMSLTEKENIVSVARLLKDYHNSPKPLNLLPSIRAKDLQPSKKANSQTVFGKGVTLYESKVNGIVYVEIKGQIPLDTDYVDDIPLLKAVLTGVGGGDLDEEAFSTQEALYTGGFKCDIAIKPGTQNHVNETEASFVIKGSSLSRNIENLFSLLDKMLLSPMLNNSEQIAVLVSMLAANSDNKILNSGDEYVMRYSAAGLTKSAALDEMLSGFTAVKRISYLARSNDWSSVAVRIQKVYKHVFRMGNFSALIHCDKADEEETLSLAEELLEKLNAHVYKPKPGDAVQDFFEEITKKSQILIPSDLQSYHTSISIVGSQFNSKMSAAFSVATSLIQSEFLYPSITEKKSLAKVVSDFNPILGIVTFSTSKDKNPPLVIQTIEDSISAVAYGRIDDSMVENAIIHIISKLDAPIAPSEEGIDCFLYQQSAQDQMKRREQILNVSKIDVINAAKLMTIKPKRYVILGTNQESMIPPGFEVYEFNTNEAENTE